MEFGRFNRGFSEQTRERNSRCYGGLSDDGGRRDAQSREPARH
jgi:hypothetical protein